MGYKINIREKGEKAERAGVNKFKKHNLKSYRTFASGAIPRFKGDVILEFPGYKFNFECKHWKRMAIFRIWDKHKKEITGSFIPALMIKENNNDTLVAMHIDDFCLIADELKEYHELKKKLKSI